MVYYKVITEEDRLARQNKFIERAKSIHGDRFDYSKVYYINKYTKVCVLLGNKELWQLPHNHFHFKGINGVLEKRSKKSMPEYHWKLYKKKLKSKHRHKYWLKYKEGDIYRSKYKKREFRKIRTYKCIFCDKNFKRKELFNGYEAKYCSNKCAINHYHAKKLEEKLIYKYIIVFTEFKKKKEIVEQFILKKDAVKKFREIVEENKKITLPQKYTVKGTKTIKVDNEVVLVERNEDNTIGLKEKNELGKLINTKIETNVKYNKLIIIDKHPYHSEQYFNIMRNDSEINVNYILNNILLLDNEGKHIMVYDKNLIIKMENNIEVILSEHQYIIMDLYNYIQSYCAKNKIKYIMFMGMIDNSPMLVDYYNNKIKEKYDLIR